MNAMTRSETAKLSEFETRLAEIVGPDLARDLLQYARNPCPLEARLLREDGVNGVTPEQRTGTIELIHEYGA